MTRRMTRAERTYQTNGAIALIDERLLEELLDLPEDVRVRGIYLSEMLRAIVLHLEGGRLPKLREGYAAERVPLAVELVHDADGRMRAYLRLVLPCVTCGGQGVVGDGGYVACPACGPQQGEGEQAQ